MSPLVRVHQRTAKMLTFTQTPTSLTTKLGIIQQHPQWYTNVEVVPVEAICLDDKFHLMNDELMMINHKCMKEEWHDRCCCNCFWRWTDYGHPWTNKTSVTTPRGYVCASPELWRDGEMSVLSEWGEHGLCEVWTGKDEVVLTIDYKQRNKNES